MNSSEKNAELAEVSLSELKEISQTYDNIHHALNDVYDGIAENWQGHSAAKMLGSIENSKTEAKNARRLMADTIQKLDEYKDQIKTTKHNALTQVSSEGE